MPPKDNKKGGKQLLVLAQLTALQSTYKAASRRYNVPPIKEISVLLEERIQEQAHINKISLVGPQVHWQHLASVLDCMAGYPAVKNLCLWSCNVGDEGLVRIAQLLKSSAADKWWRGSKVKQLELCGDGAGINPGSWSERYMSHVNGGLASEGPGFQLPSLLLGTATEGTASLGSQGSGGVTGATGVKSVTLDTLKVSDQLGVLLYSERRGAPSSLALQRDFEAELRRQAEPLGGTGLGGGGGEGIPGAAAEAAEGEAGEEGAAGDGEEGGDREGGDAAASARDEAVQAARSAVQSEACSSDDEADGTGRYTTVLGQTASCSAASGQLLRSLPPIPPTLGAPFGAPQSQPSMFSRPAPSAPLLLKLQQRLVLDQQVSPLEAAAAGHLLTSATYQAQVQTKEEEREWLHASRRQQGLPPLVGSPDDAAAGRQQAGRGTDPGAEASCPSLPSYSQPLPLAWSPPALKELSLSLSVLGLTLQVLSLDHNQLGNVGARILAQGLKRCLSLQHLSLENCGIGAVGAEALAETMALQPHAPEHEALKPRYIALNLSRNPLGGLGVAALCLGLRHCSTLRILNLADTQLGPQDLPALRCLLHVLEARPAIEQVDLDANFLGDIGTLVFIPFLAKAKHMRKFRLSLRGLSPPVGAAVTALLRSNQPKKKGVRRKAKK